MPLLRDVNGDAAPVKDFWLCGFRWGCIYGGVNDIPGNALDLIDEDECISTREQFLYWENSEEDGIHMGFKPGWCCKATWSQAFIPMEVKVDDAIDAEVVNPDHSSMLYEISPTTGRYIVERDYQKRLRDMKLPYFYDETKLPKSFESKREFEIEIGTVRIAILHGMGHINWFIKAFPQCLQGHTHSPETIGLIEDLHLDNFKLQGTMIDFVMQKDIVNLPLLMKYRIPVFYPITVAILTENCFRWLNPDLYEDFQEACQRYAVTDLALPRLESFHDRWAVVDQYDIWFQPLKEMPANPPRYFRDNIHAYMVDHLNWRRRSIEFSAAIAMKGHYNYVQDTEENDEGGITETVTWKHYEKLHPESSSDRHWHYSPKSNPSEIRERWRDYCAPEPGEKFSSEGLNLSVPYKGTDVGNIYAAEGRDVYHRRFRDQSEEPSTPAPAYSPHSRAARSPSPASVHNSTRSVTPEAREDNMDLDKDEDEESAPAANGFQQLKSLLSFQLNDLQLKMKKISVNLVIVLQPRESPGLYQVREITGHIQRPTEDWLEHVALWQKNMLPEPALFDLDWNGNSSWNTTVIERGILSCVESVDSQICSLLVIPPFLLFGSSAFDVIEALMARCLPFHLAYERKYLDEFCTNNDLDAFTWSLILSAKESSGPEAHISLGAKGIDYINQYKKGVMTVLARPHATAFIMKGGSCAYIAATLDKNVFTRFRQGPSVMVVEATSAQSIKISETGKTVYCDSVSEAEIDILHGYSPGKNSEKEDKWLLPPPSVINHHDRLLEILDALRGDNSLPSPEPRTKKDWCTYLRRRLGNKRTLCYSDHIAKEEDWEYGRLVLRAGYPKPMNGHFLKELKLDSEGFQDSED
ncbi:hypothetical protein C8J56DRAFT_884341 [Mycena floridula]|nr:hypothetical protein C8J56DRAFT_884341 [Mycena floridula]